MLNEVSLGDAASSPENQNLQFEEKKCPETLDANSAETTSSLSFPDFIPANFGNENQDVIESMTYDELKKNLKLTPSTDTLLAMIKKINLNPHTPANRNILMADVKDDKIMLFQRNRWNWLDSKEVIMNLIGRNRLRFYDLEAILTKNLKKKALIILDEFLDDIEAIANGSSKADESNEDFNTLFGDIKKELVRLSAPMLVSKKSIVVI